jgi:hypothetical protein
VTVPFNEAVSSRLEDRYQSDRRIQVVELELMDLRRFAIDNRLEIRFKDAETGRECLINVRGQVKITGEDKDFHIAGVLSAAESFELIGGAKPQRLTREATAELVKSALKKRGFGATTDDHED